VIVAPVASEVIRGLRQARAGDYGTSRGRDATISVAGVLGGPSDGAAEPPDGERTVAARQD
jgi:hypothetical protein